MDLRASSVNEASVVSERQVLPRFGDHAHDVAVASEMASDMGVFILDFKNAFMSLPLARSEMGYNASVIPEGLERSREALYGEEPVRGTVLIWRVLGFGGHSNPLTYSRAATFAARSAQALLSSPVVGSHAWALGRMQLYVDDPALTLAGPTVQQQLSVDLVVAWWLCLGIPLSWDKGSLACSAAAHDWIGVTFQCRQPGTCTMTVPNKFHQEVLVLARLFADPSTSTAPLAKAHALCGKAGRLAQVVPEVRPFTSALFSALSACLMASAARAREAPPNKVATRRFRHAASWLVSLLAGQPFALEHTLYLRRPLVPTSHRRVEFDASPWGGGAVLIQEGHPSEFFVVEWTNNSAAKFGAVPGQPRWQTFWEFATLVLAMAHWAPNFEGLVFAGDNIGSLQLALHGRVKGVLAAFADEYLAEAPPSDSAEVPLLSPRVREGLAALARELFVRKAKAQWHFGVCHLASEANVLADRLSRRFQPGASTRLPSSLVGCAELRSPCLEDLWTL